MLLQLINHNPDIKRLFDEGYQLELRGGYLLIHHIPYVNAGSEVLYGTLVNQLPINGNIVLPPQTHVIHFNGEHPCNKNGSIISGIQHCSDIQNFGNDIVVHHSFSNKPKQLNCYANHYDKIKRYAEMISAPAKSLNSQVTEKPFLPMIDYETDSVFNYVDTNSSRANIDKINDKLKLLKVGIIGLGGTGSYILDMVSKSRVKEIHLFDADNFNTHNAFRSPGAAQIEILENGISKVDYFITAYSKIRKNLFGHSEYIHEDNLHLLNELDFVFISIDNNDSRKIIIEYLVKKSIPFIDVGMGLEHYNEQILGSLRVTSASEEKFDHIKTRVPMQTLEDNAYTTNIQICELNALNAAMAVIKWKKLFGFYQDLEYEHHSVYSLNVNLLTSEEIKA